MRRFNEINVHNSTVIEWEGKLLITTQDPYPTDEGKMYTALAIDEDGNKYILVWDNIDPLAVEKSKNHWDQPSGITRIK
ncbi:MULTISPECIES: hypothetical protein [Paenibacillus]|uniref:hypothetical protein n=1 Tax=Paenibacillus TaxID=44249 RepID=UPI0011655425|nr:MULTISPECIES: hypothetical protein [Paenibacillus]AWP25246.1 hypothetical protein B9D94_00765 [Paenibacillus sp. Cedars]MBX4152465.1 hypothetical protein [Paenibacillus lautus]MCT1402853.1 hypothetical protein [Paenibacillus sp. p3-SID867]